MRRESARQSPSAHPAVVLGGRRPAARPTPSRRGVATRPDCIKVGGRPAGVAATPRPTSAGHLCRRDVLVPRTGVGGARGRRARQPDRARGTNGRVVREPASAGVERRRDVAAGRNTAVNVTGRAPVAAVAAAGQRRVTGERTGAPQQDRLRDPRHPRRPGARPDDRRGDPADLRDLDLQAGRRRRAARRLRVQPLRQPDPHRAGGVPRGAGGRRARLRLRLRARRRGHAPPRACRARRPRGHPRRRLRRHVPAVRQGRAGRGASSTARRRSPTSTPCAPRSGPGETKLVWVETPTNPLLNIADIEALAELAHDAGALLVVDNTFASPYLQQPLTLGADVVVHSTTKYCRRPLRRRRRRARRARPRARREGRLPPERDGRGRRPVRRLAGAARAQDAGVRMDRHCDNAERVVEFLPATRGSRRSTTPGCPSHPGHEVAARQMKRFGGMVSFRVTGGEEQALDVCEQRRGVHARRVARRRGVADRAPGRMTHARSRAPTSRCPADLIRLSVGIETVDDLIADLDRALG